MEQKALNDKSAQAFTNAIAVWFKFAFVTFIIWVVTLTIGFLWAWGIKKVQVSKTISPIYVEQNITTQNYYQVASAKLTSNITGEAVVSMDSFIVPAKFVYDTSTQNGEPVIDIISLEIGEITDLTGKHKYNDFTNSKDHRGINTALVSYIKKHNLMEGI